METRPEQPDLSARSTQAVHGGSPDRMPVTPSGQGPLPGPRAALSLVASSALTLAQANEDAPEDWQLALDQLARWLELDVHMVPVRPVSGIRQVVAWANPMASANVVPVFAPWRNVSPVAFQAGGDAGLPRAHWVASYLHDHGTGRPLKTGGIDIALMSPLPMACVADEPGNAPLPRADVMQEMLRAALSEGRKRVGIVVDARRRNAMVRQMLYVGRTASRDEQEIELLSIEDALCHLVRHVGRWDAIIVLPDLRSLIFAMLAEITGIWSPWPMLWHQRGVSMISGEVLDDAEFKTPLNAPMLVQSLALAAHNAGFGHAAQRLMQGAAHIWDCGIVTPGRGSVAPYVTELSDQEFIDALCKGGASGARKARDWRAIPAPQRSGPQTSRAALRLVAASGDA